MQRSSSLAMVIAIGIGRQDKPMGKDEEGMSYNNATFGYRYAFDYRLTIVMSKSVLDPKSRFHGGATDTSVYPPGRRK